MDASLLTLGMFWRDPAPFAAGDFPGEIPVIRELRGQVLFETSGSSGTPKWIVLSKQALLTSAAAVNAHLGVTAASRWGLVLPARHVGGFGVAARAFAAGCGFHEFGNRWNAAEFTTWLAEKRITHTSLVPTQVHDLVSANLRAPAALQAIVVGGGHLDVETGRAARNLGWPVLASYGMTEACSQIATQNVSSLYQPSPIPLLPIWQAAVSDEGKLRIAGPAIFSGFLVPDGSTWIYMPHLSEWYETQDRITISDQGLTPLGRADTLVKVLGELVDPEAIERELTLLSEGKLAPGSFIIAAVPDARAGHALVPVFETSVNREMVERILTIYSRSALGFRRLGPAVLMEDFPRSPLGKPRRAEITARCVSNA